MAKGFLRICLLLLIPQLGLTQTPSQSAVVSSHPLATKAGIEILRQGGNAFDAAVSVAAVLAVVDRGLNGGGIWLLRDASAPKIKDLILDARIPASTVQEGSEQFHTAALAYLAAHYGKLPLSQTLAPAIKLAKKDFSWNESFSNVTVSNPLKGEYNDMKIFTSPLPSTGGITLLTALNILGDFELNDLSEADKKHLVIESLRAAEYDKCTYLSDLDASKANFSKLISEEHAQEWREKIKMNKAIALENVDCKKPNKLSTEVANYAILDQQGNSVSATLTSAEPLKAIAPTLFEISEGVGLIGSAGQDRIPAIILLCLLTAMDDYYPNTWMLTPRYYPFLSPILVEYETDGFPDPLQKALELRGYQLKEVIPFGQAQGIFWDKENNKVHAASDPRGKGLAIVEKI